VRVGLQIDLLDAPAVDEVVDVGPAPGDGDGLVDGFDRDPEGARLRVVHLQLELRDVVLAVRAHPDEPLVLCRQPE